MAYCWRTSVILQSIDHIRTAQRKRPHPTNVLEYASRHFGLYMSEGRVSLMMLRTVYNKPKAAGLTSLFIKKHDDVNNPEIVEDQVGEFLSNNILDTSKEHEMDCNGPTALSFTSPFIENTCADNAREDMLIRGDKKMSDNILDSGNDSFLQLRDALEQWCSAKVLARGAKKTIS